MAAPADAPLLAPDEPPPVEAVRPDGSSPIFLVCDHAGNGVPRCLGTLGLDAAALQRHIAYDIGAFAVARGLAERLDAALLAQPYARLVIDCNRRPHACDSIATVSEYTEIPGNRDLPAGQAEARRREILEPYQAAVGAALDRRTAAARPTAIVSLHSFTPVYKGQERPWHLGIISGPDQRGAAAMLACLDDAADLVVGVDQPYVVDMDNDYTLPVHAEGRGLPYVEIEIRQDLIAERAAQAAWAERLAGWLPRWLNELGAQGVL